MNKYYNSDQSMLTMMVAVDNIINKIEIKMNIWPIKNEQELHEEKNSDENNTKNQFQIKFSPPNKEDFVSFIVNKGENRVYLIVAIFSLIFQLSFFKYWYPFASFINGDSYQYLISAFQNTDIDIYPIGYPKFLRLFSVFSHSDTLLVTIQYIFIQGSLVSFLFTIFYFFKPSKIIKNILFVFFVYNPIFLYLANYISSDGIFFSLSIMWFNTLLWIFFRPSLKLILIHSIVLFLLFITRYNALYYPLFSLLCFFYRREKILTKGVGILLSILLLLSFVHFNEQRYFEETGVRQFSPFSGWQLANNAMYAYKFVDRQDLKVVPPKFKKLDKIVRDYFDSTKNNVNHPEEKWMASTIYMWTPNTPLRSYLHITHHLEKDKAASFKDWASIGPFYNEYGRCIISLYPWSFLKFYVLPNALKFYSPPIEFLQYYSTGVDSVQPIAQHWFNYRTNKINTIFKDFKVNVLNYYPVFVGITNVLFFLLLISFYFLKNTTNIPLIGRFMFLVFLFWCLNMLFSIFASPISLRFQIFSNVVVTCFCALLFEYICEATYSGSNK